MTDSEDSTQRKPASFSDSQLAGLEARDADQARTLEAIHALEEAAASPAPGREKEWRLQIQSALAALDEVMADEYRNAELPESLLSDIRRTQPRLRTRVRGVRSQYVQIRQWIADLRDEVEHHETADETDYADVRIRIGWLLTALRHQPQVRGHVTEVARWRRRVFPCAPEAGAQVRILPGAPTKPQVTAVMLSP